MSNTIIKDGRNNVVGSISSNGNTTIAYDKNHNYLGKFVAGTTYNNKNQNIGKSNQLLRLFKP